MSKPVLFVTGLGKEIERAENMFSLFCAYDGAKSITSTHNSDYYSEVRSGKYDLMVIDVFPTVSPGKAVMIWHSIMGGKMIGLDDRTTYYRRTFAKLMDYVISSGEESSKMLHKCTLVPKENILNLGMPRTDRYIGKKKGDGGTFLAEKKAYLFVPTYRGIREPQYPEIRWHQIDEQLTDDEVLVVKGHPYGLPINVPKCKHIVELSKMEPTVNYLYDCDVVITDYSTTLFDGYLLGKPGVLFEKETGYVRSRGMYLKYPEQYCSRYARNENELIRMVRSADGLGQIERDCIEMVANTCDGHSCERICKFIHEINGLC